MKLLSIISNIFMFFLGIFFLAGCAGSLDGYKGYTVSEENRIALEETEEPVLGVWSTGDLSLKYDYLLNGNMLQLGGKLTLASKLTHFNVLDRLYFRVHFLDSDGRILGTRPVYISPYRKWIPMVRFSFRRLLSLPPGSVSVAFSYSGKVSEGTGGTFDKGDGAITWDFWRSP